LRVARFAARFSDFHVASETNALMRRMVDAGEVDALVPERVWQELARGLMEAKPSHMFAVLHACGALQRILPELAAVLDSGVMPVIDYAARQHYALPIRVAALLQGLHPAGTLSTTTTTTTTTTSTALDAHATEAINLLEQVCERLKIPNDCRDLARMRVREHATLQEAFSLDAAKLVRLLERCDAFRKPQRYMEMLISAESTEIAQLGDAARPWAQRAYLTALLQAAQSVNAGQVAALHPNAPEQIALAIHAARVAAVRVFQAQTAG
jgi:tRNA nucleotidyltransferase (CCA-adding enzyme)